MRLWWFRPAPGTTNFGDELGPEIIKRLGYEIERVPLGEAELVGVGSILGLVQAKAKSGLAIWGSGFLVPTDNLTKNKFKILALRGSLTANKVGVNVPLGDPAVLVPKLWDYKASPRHRIGVVPHYVDRNKYPWADKVIDPRRPVDEVIREILSCSCIASSSLHGLIVAAAYGIPTMRLQHSGVIGGEFKWVDYMSGISGRELEQVQNDLVTALKSL